LLRPDIVGWVFTGSVAAAAAALSSVLVLAAASYLASCVADDAAWEFSVNSSDRWVRCFEKLWVWA
jgi:hypothetical protein